MHKIVTGVRDLGILSMNFLKSYQLGMSSHNHSRVLVRHFLKLFLPLSALVGGVLAVIYYGQVQAERVVLETDELRNIEVQAKVINGDFHSVVSDLMVVSGHEELDEILNNVNEQTQALTQEALRSSSLIRSNGQGSYQSQFQPR